MTHVHQSLLNEMIGNISDPGLRERYASAIAGKFKYEVYCLDPKKDPDTKKLKHAKKCLIGYIDKNGLVTDVQAVDKKTKEPIAGIETSRDRLDGRKGFRCYCGNWSIQADEERGIISSKAPTKSDFEAIYEKLQKSGKGSLTFIDGWVEYDGFGLQEITT